MNKSNTSPRGKESESTKTKQRKPNKSNYTKNDNNKTFEFSAGNWISLGALCIALFTFGWRVLDAFVGPNVDMMSLSDRTIELRCHTRNVKKCWEERTGRFTVILPAFFANRGAKEYGEAVNRVTAEVTIADRTITLTGNKFWFFTNYGGNRPPQPFKPIVVPGGSSAGGELHFVSFKPGQFASWADIADKIIDRQITRLSVKLIAHLTLSSPPTVSTRCQYTINEQQRKKLQERRDSKSKQVRLSGVCD